MRAGDAIDDMIIWWRSVRADWEAFKAKVRDARAHDELRYAPPIVLLPAAWAWAWGKQYLADPSFDCAVMLELVIGVPSVFLMALALDLRRYRKRMALLQEEELQLISAEQRRLEQSQHRRGDLSTYRLVRGPDAARYGLPRTPHFQEVARGRDGTTWGIDHEVGEIRPAKLPQGKVLATPEDDDEPTEVRPKRRHGQYSPLR